MELYLEPVKLTRNPVTGHFLRGVVQFRDNKPWTQRKIPKKSKKKILANLTNEGRKLGALASKPSLCIKVVGIKDGEFFGMFESAAEAELKLKKLDIKVCATNIRNCCKGKRPSAGGIKWYYEADFEGWNGEIENVKCKM